MKTVEIIGNLGEVIKENLIKIREICGKVNSVNHM